MPTIVRLTRCKICMYAGDHAPPHFHVRSLKGPAWTASVAIASFRILKGKGPKADLEEAIRWAMVPDNLYRLVYEWRRLNERD